MRTASLSVIFACVMLFSALPFVCGDPAGEDGGGTRQETADYSVAFLFPDGDTWEFPNQYKYKPSTMDDTDLNINAEVLLNIAEGAEFTGVLEVEVTVTASVSDIYGEDTGWDVSVYPGSLTMEPENDTREPVTVTVTVPDDHEYGNYTLVVDGDSSTEPVNREAGVVPGSIAFDILPFYDVSAEAVDESLDVNAGDTGREIDFEVSNLGNALDQYSFNVTNKDDLELDDITISYPSYIEVGPGKKRGGTLEVFVGPDAPSGTYTVEFEVQSLNAIKKYDDEVDTTFELTIEVTAKSDPPINMIMAFVILIIVVLIILLAVRSRKRRTSGGDDFDEDDFDEEEDEVDHRDYDDDEVEFETVQMKRRGGKRRKKGGKRS